MSAIVLDASVAIAWCFPDQRTPQVRDVLEAVSNGMAVVPSLWMLEVCNILALCERKESLTSDQSRAFLDDLLVLPLHVEHQEPAEVASRVLPLARKHRLTSYDASYLEIALRMGLPLATLDHALLRAAEEADVALFERR